MEEQMTGVTVVGGGFELGDSDAFECVVEKVLGRKRYVEMKRETASLPSKGMANDRMVDEAFRILNKPLVRLVLSMLR